MAQTQTQTINELQKEVRELQREVIDLNAARNVMRNEKLEVEGKLKGLIGAKKRVARRLVAEKFRLLDRLEMINLELWELGFKVDQLKGDTEVYCELDS